MLEVLEADVGALGEAPLLAIGRPHQHCRIEVGFIKAVCSEEFGAVEEVGLLGGFKGAFSGLNQKTKLHWVSTLILILQHLVVRIIFSPIIDYSTALQPTKLLFSA